MSVIKLTKGKVAVVDHEDHECLSKFKWCLHNCGYACRGNKLGMILLHRYLLGAEPGQSVDHINGDKLDNRRSNLRLCSIAENSRNQKMKRSKSPYKGVEKHKLRWKAYITLNYKKRHIGSFKSAEDAALAYDMAAAELHGLFARLNFPNGEDKP